MLLLQGDGEALASQVNDTVEKSFLAQASGNILNYTTTEAGGNCGLPNCEVDPWGMASCPQANARQYPCKPKLSVYAISYTDQQELFFFMQ